MLAGLPQAPLAYDPFAHYAFAKQRQRHVLDWGVAIHYLTSAPANVAYREPLPLGTGMLTVVPDPVTPWSWPCVGAGGRGRRNLRRGVL